MHWKGAMLGLWLSIFQAGKTLSRINGLKSTYSQVSIMGNLLDLSEKKAHYEEPSVHLK